LYLAFHESLNFKWNEYLYSLNYIAGVVAVAGIVYYLIEKVEPLAKGLIYIVAWKSVWILNLFGFDASLGGFGHSSVTNELGLAINGSHIGIILACTGIQSIAIFVGILVVTKSDRSLWVPWTKKFLKKPMPEEIKRSKLRNWLWESKKRRMRKVLKMTDKSRFFRVFMYTIPIIYVLNFLRNSVIIWGVENEIFGTWQETYNILHNQISKYLSLAVLIVMAYVVFELLPESLEGIMGLIDLPKRTSRGMVKDGFIMIKPKESKAQAEKDEPAKKSTAKPKNLKKLPKDEKTSPKGLKNKK
jgi:exosortase/archaeosortase family protein